MRKSIKQAKMFDPIFLAIGKKEKSQIKQKALQP
jgi:hypothetical protein